MSVFLFLDASSLQHGEHTEQIGDQKRLVDYDEPRCWIQLTALTPTT